MSKIFEPIGWMILGFAALMTIPAVILVLYLLVVKEPIIGCIMVVSTVVGYFIDKYDKRG